MADFVQTMKDWRRMCKTLGADSCEGCKVHADGNDCVAVYEGEMDYAKLEKAVTIWAAENPEPVYPTWGEWLISVGAARKIPTGIPFELQDGRIVDSPWEIVVAVNTPIPADTAQKLGIEPKHG